MRYRVHVERRRREGPWKVVGDFYTDDRQQADDLVNELNQYEALFAEVSES